MFGFVKQDGSKMISRTFRKSAKSKIISAESGTIATVIDSIIVGKYLGLDALGAYGIAIPVIYLIIAISKLLSDGGARQCAISIGKGDRKKSDIVFSTTIICALAISVVFMLLFFITPKTLAEILGAKSAASSYLNGAADFLRGYAIGIPGHIMLLTLIPFAQLEGKISLVSVAGYSMAIVDVLLDLANVYIFHYGIWGMALATAISEYVGAIILCVSLIRKNSEFHFSLYSFNPKLIFRIGWDGAPGFLSYFFTSVRSIVSNHAIIAFLPISVLPLYSGISSLMNLFYPVGKGVGSTTMVFSSIFYGEEDIEGLGDILNTSVIYTLITNLMFMVILIVFAPLLLKLFLSTSKEEMELAIHGTRIIALSLIPFSLHTIFRSYMQGIGRIFQTTLFLAIYECVISASSVYVFSYFYSTNGFWFSFLIREVITIGLAIAFVKILNHLSKQHLKFKDALLLVFDKFNINEEESYTTSIYQTSDVHRVLEKTKEIMKTSDFMIDEYKQKTTKILDYIQKVTREVFKQKFPKREMPELRIRLYKKEGRWTLNFRDNAERFDMISQGKLSSCNAKYIRSINQNVLVITEN